MLFYFNFKLLGSNLQDLYKFTRLTVKEVVKFNCRSSEVNCNVLTIFDPMFITNVNEQLII